MISRVAKLVVFSRVKIHEFQWIAQEEFGPDQERIVAAQEHANRINRAGRLNVYLTQV
jgi:hypothetical protein